MKWFFALNEDSSTFDHYAEMVKVAVLTAANFTSLEPVFLYVGNDNELTDWLVARNIHIVHRRTFLYNRLAELAEQKGDRNILSIGAGAFLRVEFPKLVAELEISDKWILYTDVDVMFLSDVSDLDTLTPRYFSVAPEFDINDYRAMNSGVMLMNVVNLKDTDEGFRSFTERNLKKLSEESWDQAAYRHYYKKTFFGFKWDRLPQEYNWKTYWGENTDAKIIHFHGPKPFHRPHFETIETPEAAKSLLPLVTESFRAYSKQWDHFLAEAESDT